MIARDEKNVVSQQACEELMTKMDKDSSFIVVKRESSSTKHYCLLRPNLCISQSCYCSVSQGFPQTKNVVIEYRHSTIFSI